MGIEPTKKADDDVPPPLQLVRDISATSSVSLRRLAPTRRLLRKCRIRALRKRPTVGFQHRSVPSPPQLIRDVSAKSDVPLERLAPSCRLTGKSRIVPLRKRKRRVMYPRTECLAQAS